MTNPTLIAIVPHLEITTDGQYLGDGWTLVPATVRLDEGDTTYDYLKSIIGGTIATVQTHEGVDVWHDDEFLYNGCEPNPLASLICGQEMRGPVVLARCDAEGNTVGFSDEEVAQATARLKHAAEIMGLVLV